jgi:Uma2 family endonuclease
MHDPEVRTVGAPLSVTGLLSAAELSYEPDDGLRRELHDGVVLVIPPPNDDHSWEVRAADRTLSATVPDDVYILRNVGVHVGLRRLYVPDLVVVYRDTAFHDYGYDPDGMLLAVEVVSPSSVTLDRITKPAVYAEQAIPFYWRIEAEPRLLCYRLDPATGDYLLDRELAPGEKAELTEPWPLTVDMAELVMPHKC